MTDQDGFAWRFDWGGDGLRALAPAADAVVLVDVLRFTTAVTVAIEHGCTVAPVPTAGSTGRPLELSPRWIRTHRVGPADGDVGGRRVNRRRAAAEPPQRIAGTEAVAGSGG